jgi:signal peptidase II
VIRRSAGYLILVAVGVVAIDQLTKFLALKFLTEGASKPLIGEVLKLYLIRNDSAAFSIGFGQTWFFTIFSSLAVLALLWFGPRVQTRGWAIICGLLLGGVVGNLIDRIFRQPGFPNGQVIDFLQIPFNFPIFNVADTAIVVSMGIFAIRIMRGHKFGK